MQNITLLQPQVLWNYFDEICHIPRPSKKEGRIIAYLQEFAAKHRLHCKTDASGNVLISKPATIGNEAVPITILQTHVDMVCEKNANSTHNFDIDTIKTYVEDDWVKAKDTTLGADNGIGLAAQLAILSANDISHGPIECLFTVDEESGLTGAVGLSPDFLQGKILLNLDSEDEGELFIGCAGGIDTIASFDYWMEKSPADYFFFSVEISGLRGGHSGDDINKGRANANKLMANYLHRISCQFDVRLVSIEGGNLRNAIAREAKAIVAVPMSEKETVRVELNHFIYDVETEYLAAEPKLQIHLESMAKMNFVINRTTSQSLIRSLFECPHGVIAMSTEMPDLVECSTNLASVKMSERKIVVATSQRSAENQAKKNISAKVAGIFTSAGATVRYSDGYPAWEPNPQSVITKMAAEVYKQFFGVSPKIKAIHAGLECGLFLEKYPQLDMVSFGPTIKGAHSPDEQVQISSVQRFWQFLLLMLSSIS